MSKADDETAGRPDDDLTVGLTSAEAKTLIRQHGYNEVADRPAHPLRRFLGKFWGLSAWMLELIIVLSAVLRKVSDLVIVTALLVLNAVLAYAQERRAAGVVQTLMRRLQVSARVLRDATWQQLAARELVPGDIVHVRRGHRPRRSAAPERQRQRGPVGPHR